MGATQSQLETSTEKSPKSPRSTVKNLQNKIKYQQNQNKKKISEAVSSYAKTHKTMRNLQNNIETQQNKNKKAARQKAIKNKGGTGHIRFVPETDVRVFNVASPPTKKLYNYKRPKELNKERIPTEELFEQILNEAGREQLLNRIYEGKYTPTQKEELISYGMNTGYIRMYE